VWGYERIYIRVD